VWGPATLALLVPLAFVPSEVAFARAVEDTVIALGLQQSSWDSAAGYDFYSDLAPPQLAVNFVPTIVSLIEANARGPASSLNGAEESDVASRYHPIRPPAAEARHQRKVTTEGALVIGAGDYARTQIIPALKRAGVPLHTVVDLEPYLAEHVRRRFGFARASTDWREAISQPETQIVIIASYHDSHAEIAATALRAGKKVFLEKPPAVTRGDLACLMEFVETPNSFLEVGYNRRFAPFTRRAKEFMSEAPGPTSITCLVKEVEIPDQHWYRWPKEGTRITGNLCHWIDLAVYFLGVSCEPSEMTITGPNLRYADDEKGVNVVFRDGSSLTIITSSRGDGTLGVQEFIEIRRGGLTIKIQDYRQLVATTGGSILCRLGSLRNKGHSAMYRESIARMRKNLPALYTSRELELTTLMTIKATEMIRNGSRSAAL